MKELVVSASDLRYFRQLYERQRCIYAALQATELGWNGVSLVCKAYNLNRKTIYKEKQELREETLSFQKAIRLSLYLRNFYSLSKIGKKVWTKMP